LSETLPTPIPREKAYVTFICHIKAELEVTGYHVHCNSGNISEVMQDITRDY